MLWLVVVQHVMCNSLSLTLHVLVLVVACLPLRIQHLSCSNPVTHIKQHASWSMCTLHSYPVKVKHIWLAGMGCWCAVPVAPLEDGLAFMGWPTDDVGAPRLDVTGACQLGVNRPSCTPLVLVRRRACHQVVPRCDLVGGTAIAEWISLPLVVPHKELGFLREGSREEKKNGKVTPLGQQTHSS